jgi:hypothetical protein
LALNDCSGFDRPAHFPFGTVARIIQGTIGVAGKIDAISVQEPFAAAAARKPEIRVLSNP